VEQTTIDRSEAEVRALIRTIILELAPSPEATDIEDAHLIDALGYHSLGLLELAFTLEDEFGLPPITEEQGRSIQTVRNVEDYVVAQLSAAAGG
jgi:acyl carrier protein